MDAKAPTVEEWLAERRTCIGGSDAPIVMQCAPPGWGVSRQKLWGEKCGLIDPETVDNDELEMGRLLEPVVCERLAKKSRRQVTLWPARRIARHKDIPWMACTPDATCIDDDRGPGLVQIKTRGELAELRTKDWSDGVPLHVQVQVQHEMEVMGASWCCVAVLIGRRLEWFDLEPQPDFVRAMIEREREFWGHVQSREQPPVDDGDAVYADSVGRALAKLHPKDNGETVVLPPAAAEWDTTLTEAKATIAEAEKQKAIAEARLKEVIGDATYGLLPDGTMYTWRHQNRAGFYVEPTSFRVLRRQKGR